jgi:Protein of unknown function (DUF4199)
MRYALVYGVLSGAIVIGIMVATIALHLTGQTHSLWFGYLIMLVALSMIFVGIKRYRDVECGGVIRFGRAFGLGLGIAAVAGLICVICWELYLWLSGWNFMADYSADILARMRAEGASPAALQAKQAEMRQMAEMYANPLYRMPMTFAEIFPVGFVIALLSAALLRNPRLLPATARPAAAS